MHLTICQSVTVNPDGTFDMVRGGLTHLPLEPLPQHFDLPLLIETPSSETPAGKHALSVTTTGAATGSQMRVTSYGMATIDVTLGGTSASIDVTFVKPSKA
jgi:hypothetical protein